MKKYDGVQLMENSELKETPLREQHLAAGAKLVPFAGWNMPVQYAEGIIAEHLRTRTAVSLFDICHMGEFEVDGPKAAAELDRILARPVLDQPPGSCRYNFLLNDAGGVQDDLIVYRLDAEGFFIVVNAATAAHDAAEFRRGLSGDTEFNDVSAATGKLDLQGPQAAEILVELGVDRQSLPCYYHWTNVEIAGIPCLLSRTGYTGELGFELYVAVEDTASLWELLTARGVKPAGLGARDTLRLEMGYPLYGHELDLYHTPVEAGFGAMLRLAAMPSRRFVGSAALRHNAPRQYLRGIRLEGRRAARAGMMVQDIAGNVIGRVTSGAFAPTLGVAVAMAWIDAAAISEVGTVVNIEAGKTLLPGKIAALPFYDRGTARMKTV
ncbi:MAG: glycine cleavage system aminomethyltransferase GcvT [Victivallales bacterium]|nr:glycine cleavage system aminomethyltransferase GcvT [Victivallales bacterium]